MYFVTNICIILLMFDQISRKCLYSDNIWQYTAKVELTPFENSWPITNTDWVLWEFENCVILH